MTMCQDSSFIHTTCDWKNNIRATITVAHEIPKSIHFLPGGIRFFFSSTPPRQMELRGFRAAIQVQKQS